MNLVNILLLIQLSFLFTLPILRWLLYGLKKEVKGSNLIFSIIQGTLCITVIVVYFIFNEPINSTYQLFGISDINFNVGLMITNTRMIFYGAFILTILFYMNYISVNQENWSNKRADRISFLALFLIPIIFSPNLFQTMVSWFIFEILFIEYNLIVTRDGNDLNRLGLKQSIFSIIVSNILIYISFILLLLRTKSFNFSNILNDIQFKFFINTPYFVIMTSFFFVGVLAKLSIFPFHQWSRNISSGSNFWNFPIILIYISSVFILILETPYLYLIPSMNQALIWGGICIGLITLFTSFISKEKDTMLPLIVSTMFSYAIFSLGSFNHDVAFILVNTVLVAITLLVMILLPQQDQIPLTSAADFPKKLEFSNILIPAIFAFLSFSLIGIPPFSSLFKTVLDIYVSQSLPSYLAIVILDLLFLFLLLIFGVKIYHNFWELRHEKMGVKNSIRISLFLLVLLGLSVLFPYFHLFNPYGMPFNADSSQLMILILPIGIVFLVYVTLYIIVNLIYTKGKERIGSIVLTFEKHILPIYYFDFLYKPLETFYKEALIPGFKWINRIIIEKFLIGILYASVVGVSLFIYRETKKLILNVIIPKIKSFFTFLSLSLRKLESISERYQLIFIFSSTAILLLLALLLFIGGIIA